MPRKKKAPEIEEQLRSIIGEALTAKRFTLASKLLAILEEDAIRPEPEIEPATYKHVEA